VDHSFDGHAGNIVLMLLKNLCRWLAGWLAGWLGVRGQTSPWLVKKWPTTPEQQLPRGPLTHRVEFRRKREEISR